MLSNSSVLNSMTIRLKHMHYLETSTYVMGSKVNLGSLGVLQKRAGYVSLLRHNLLSSFFFLLTLPAERGRVLYTSSSSSSSSSSFCQHVISSDMLHPNLTKLGHKWPVPWPLLRHKQWWGQRSRWGHWGQKVIFTKNAIIRVLWLHSMVILTHTYWSARYLLQKLWVQKIVIRGHLGSQGVKRSFSPKLLFLLQITWYGHVTHAYWSAWYPLQKLSV